MVTEIKSKSTYVYQELQHNTTQQLNTHQIVVVVIQFTKENSE